jgi:TetR/AcrR family transcriptional repressor of mexCD-oprJ operon
MGTTETKRADAKRSIAAILAAATECLSRDPAASTSEIAKAAGVGRVTLYGHFPSRADLVDAVFVHAIESGRHALDAVDLNGETLPPGRIRDLHAGPMARVERLIERGQADGVFRTDLPMSWLVSVMHNVMHGATADIEAGRITSDKAAEYITATLLAAFTRPGDRVPG